ncbi:MAG: winged helix DNA-binding protein [Armatimonadetes bacterium]|nr:winged helix DNA-binding protein [Armatimonadota bacterium]
MEGPDILARVAMLYEVQANAIQPRLKKLGSSWSTFQLLSAIHGPSTGIIQAEVARSLGITAATLTETIQTHLKRGLIEQFKDPVDGRAKRVRLSRSGTSLLRKMVVEIDAVEAKMLGTTPAKDLEKLATAIDRLIANLDPTYES